MVGYPSDSLASQLYSALSYLQETSKSVQFG